MEEMLKLVIALALVVGSVQCASACTPVAAAQPACHHHKQAPSCSHELLPATIVQATAFAVTFSAEAVEILLVSAEPATFLGSPAQSNSPPGSFVPPQTILRI